MFISLLLIHIIKREDTILVIKKLIINILPEINPQRISSSLSGLALLGLAFSLSILIVGTPQPIGQKRLSVDLCLPIKKVTPGGSTTTSSLNDAALNTLTKTIKIKSGDTLSHLLRKQGVPTDSIYKIVKVFNTKFSVRRLKPGHEVSLTYRPLENDTIQLFELLFRPKLDKILSIKLNEDFPGNPIYEASETGIQLEKEFRRVSGQVNSSVFSSMLERGVPPVLINTLIHAFSYDIDFQRDIRSDDVFTVVMERYFDPETGSERAGEILFSSINVKGKNHKVYYFHPKKGEPNFFTANGVSVKKALLKTPVNGARISSGYGRRKHPVLGYTKMHKGIDFAACVGTPVMAAGDGVIERIGRYGSYGKYIRLKHKNGYSTAYAHLKGFGKNLKKGTRIKQGHIIGYIGMTGRTTGPHLHYEVLKNGRHINPKSVINKSVGERLAGEDLKNFQKAKAKIETRIAKLDISETAITKVASLVAKKNTKRTTS